MKKNLKAMLTILIIVVVILLIFLTYYFIKNKTSFFYKMQVVNADNYEEIMDIADEKLDDDELSYLGYIILKNVFNTENLYGYTINELIEKGKETMEDDGYTIKTYKEELNSLKDNNGDTVFSSSNTSKSSEDTSFKEQVVTSANLENIFDELENELNENDAYYFLYIVSKNIDTVENLYDNTVNELIIKGKKQMQEDGYTIEKFIAEFEEGNNISNSEVDNNEKSEGTLGNYYVKIGDAEIKKDRDGKSILVVDVTYTNNSDSEDAFTWSVMDSAYQDGVEIEHSYSSNVYDSDSQYKQILPGTTYNVKVAYELTNTESDVVVIMTELISLDNSKITKIFKISE